MFETTADPVYLLQKLICATVTRMHQENVLIP
ncbi:hypothetical protein RTM1035_01390 [Roseovarius sp. TM1035]|nr:hypothetical protein RTM1035_01390 [Roseovarius sp. TM1035]